MAFMNVDIELPQETIASVNEVINREGRITLQLLCNILNGIDGGAKEGQVIVVGRSTAAGVSASGGGSSQTINKK